MADTNDRGDGRLRSAGRDAVDLARDTVRESADGAAEMAAGRSAQAGEALRDAAGRMGDDPALSSAMLMAADRLDSLSSSLRGQDLGSLYRRVETFARREPGLFLAGAAIAGFALARLAAPGTAPPSISRSGEAAPVGDDRHDHGPHDPRSAAVHGPVEAERPHGPPPDPAPSGTVTPTPPRQIH